MLYVAPSESARASIYNTYNPDHLQPRVLSEYICADSIPHVYNALFVLGKRKTETGHLPHPKPGQSNPPGDERW